jgi:DNA helicase HerA-like ATPase
MNYESKSKITNTSMRKKSKDIRTWRDLVGFSQYPPEVLAQKSSLQQFLGQVHRLRNSPLFTDKKRRSKYIGDEIRKIKSNNTYVIDISMIPTLQEQSLVVGDVMMAIDELYSAIENRGTIPRYIIIFIDEINRFLPKSGWRMSAVAEQIMKTVISGKSRGTILVSAQQFKSTVEPQLHENTGLHVMGKLGESEVSTPPYSMLDKSTKRAIVRLNRGELVMMHPAFRHPIKIGFPNLPHKD